MRDLKNEELVSVSGGYYVPTTHEHTWGPYGPTSTTTTATRNPSTFGTGVSSFEYLPEYAGQTYAEPANTHGDVLSIGEGDGNHIDPLICMAADGEQQCIDPNFLQDHCEVDGAITNTGGILGTTSQDAQVFAHTGGVVGLSTNLTVPPGADIGEYITPLPGLGLGLDMLRDGIIDAVGESLREVHGHLEVSFTDQHTGDTFTFIAPANIEGEILSQFSLPPGIYDTQVSGNLGGIGALGYAIHGNCNPDPAV